MTHLDTAGLDTFVAPYVSPSGNFGWRAACPQIPGYVVVHTDHDHAIKLVRLVVLAMSDDAKRETTCQ